MAYGEDPGHCVFDQPKMRVHLYQCFLKGRLTPFPHKRKVESATMTKSRDDIEVHCHCRMPELKDMVMIECTECNGWFHVECETVPMVTLDNSEAEWFSCHCK